MRLYHGAGGSRTVKIIGHQWYWSYDVFFERVSSAFSEGVKLSIDSYILKEHPGVIRMLEVDHELGLFAGGKFIGIITSADVLHSWAVPSIGVKIDACPGRLNKTYINPLFPGVFFGQCSEICGANHRYMPIKLLVLEGPEQWSK